MTKKLPCYYWDSSIFLLLLKGETAHGLDVLDGASAIFQATEKGEAITVASGIVVTEILESQNTQKVFDKWQSALQWENIHLRAADHAVCTRASKLRSDCFRKKPRDT